MRQSLHRRDGPVAPRARDPWHAVEPGSAQELSLRLPGVQKSLPPLRRSTQPHRQHAPAPWGEPSVQLLEVSALQPRFRHEGQVRDSQVHAPDSRLLLRRVRPTL